MKNKLLLFLFLFLFFFFLSPKKTFAACPYGNIACGKGTSSNGSVWIYWPQKTVDGDYSNMFLSSKSSNGYLQIDLGASYQIAKVRLLSAGYNWWGSNTTVCLSATSSYWTGNYCLLANSSGWGDGVWGEVNFPAQSYRYVTVIANNFQGAWHEIEVYPPPPTCAISGPSSANTCSSVSYSATTTAGSGNATSTGIYYAPHNTQSWVGASGGNPYSYSFTFPSAGSWDVICNGYDSNYRCTGRTDASSWYPGYADCGASSRMVVSVSGPPAAQSCPTACGSAASTVPNGSCDTTSCSAVPSPECTSNAGCDDNNSCTTDVCSNPSTCSASCSHTNNPVNGVCGEWSTWSCSGNSRTRSRTYTAPSCGGSAVSCSPLTETVSCDDGDACTTDSCSSGTCSNSNNPVNGDWTAWSNVGSCGTYASCLQRQTRTCTNPAPSCGGAACSGASTRDISCGTITCSSAAACGTSNACTTYTCSNANTCLSSCSITQHPVNGDWSTWSNVGSCGTYASCLQRQTRTCTNPAPSCGGAACSGASTQDISCGTIACTSDSQCNDGLSCTTDTCVNWGTCLSYCTHSANFPIGGAGIVQSNSTINSGSGQISQGGTSPGFNLINYTNQLNNSSVSYSNFNKVNYNVLLSAVFKNSGVSSTFLQNYFATGAVYGPITSGSTQYRFWRISSLESLDTVLGQIIASADTTSIHVIIPQTGYFPASLTVSTAKAIAANKKVVAFVPGSLAVSANITIDAGSSAVFILNSPGDLTLDPAVTRLDGIYVFPGIFNDGMGPLQLTGYGSLLATGPADLGFNRYFYPGPAEQWFYQPKYLSIYKNVLATPTYNFSELPPQ